MLQLLLELCYITASEYNSTEYKIISDMGVKQVVCPSQRNKYKRIVRLFCEFIFGFKRLIYMEKSKTHISAVNLSLFQGILIHLISVFNKLLSSFPQISLFCIIYWSPTVKKHTFISLKETLSSDVQATAFILMLQRCRRRTQLATSLESSEIQYSS